MKILKRETYLKRIRPFYESEYIKAIVGIRRSGKSVILKQIVDEIKASGVDSSHILVYNLEAENCEDITTRKRLERRLHQDIKDDKKYYIFIDEVQHIADFEEAIASVRISYNCSLFVTGSSSSLLKGRLATRLTGRVKEFQIYPLTYREVCDLRRENGIDFQPGVEDFMNFLQFGGMPQRFEETDPNGVEDYLTDLFEGIVERDVAAAHKRIDREVLLRVGRYVIGTGGRLFSAPNVASALYPNAKKEEKDALERKVLRYVTYLEKACLIQRCEPFHLQGKEELKGTKKYYAEDVGLRNALSNPAEFEDTFALENAVFLELITRGYRVRYGKLRNGEVDFVVCQGKKKALLQVTYTLHAKETFEREYGAFDKVRDHSPKYVLSLDYEDSSHNGITHLNVIDFLLGRKDIIVS